MRTVSGDAPRVSRAFGRDRARPRRAAPGANPKADGVPVADRPARPTVVYFPACPTRLFGAPKTQLDLLPTPEAMITLLRRVGYEVIVPAHLDGQCCGQPWQSKGFPGGVRARRRPPGRPTAKPVTGRRAPVLTDAVDLRQAPAAATLVATQVADSAEFLRRPKCCRS